MAAQAHTTETYVKKYDFVLHNVTHKEAAITISEMTANTAKGSADSHYNDMVVRNVEGEGTENRVTHDFRLESHESLELKTPYYGLCGSTVTHVSRQEG